MSGPTVTAVIQADDLASAKLRAVAEMAQGLAKQLDKTSARNLTTSLKEAEVQALANERAFGRMHGALLRAVDGAKSFARQLASNAAMFAGPIILRGVEGSLKGGAEIQTQDLRNIAAGMTPAEQKQADDIARQQSAEHTLLSVPDVLKTFRELRAVLGDKSEAPAMTPVAAATEGSMKALGMSTDSLQFAFKGAELLGYGNNPEKLKDYMDAFIRAKETLGDLVTPESLFEFAKYSKSAGFQLSERFATQMGPLLSAEMGGQTAGNDVAMFEKVMAGGGMHSDYVEMIALGMAKAGDFLTTKAGGIAGLNSGHSVGGASLAASDPDKYVHDFLLPKLVEHGFKTLDTQIPEIKKIFKDRSSQDLVIKLVTQAGQFEAHLVAMNNAMGLSAEQMLVHTDATLALGAAEKQLGGMFDEMTLPAMGIWAHGLSAIADAAGWAKVEIHSFAEKFPKLAADVSAFGTALVAGYGALKSWQLLTSVFGMSNAMKLGGAATALGTSAGDLGVAAARLTGAAETLATGGKVGAAERALGAGAVDAELTTGAILGTAAVVTGGSLVGAKMLADYVNSVPTDLGKAFNDSDDSELERQQHKLELMDATQRAKTAQSWPLGSIAPPSDLKPQPGEMEYTDQPWFSRNGQSIFAEKDGPPIPAVPPQPSQGVLHDTGDGLVAAFPWMFHHPDKSPPIDIAGEVKGDATLTLNVNVGDKTTTTTAIKLDGSIGTSNTVPSGRSPMSAGGSYSY